MPIVESAPTTPDQPVRRLQARRRPHDHRRGGTRTASARCPCATSTWPARTASTASGTTPSRTSSRWSSRSRRAGARRSPSSATTTRRRTAPASATTSTSPTWPRRTSSRSRPPPPGEHLICNLGNGDGFSVRQVIETVRKVTGHPIPEVVAPRRGGDPATLVASAATAREKLGWNPSRADLAGIVADAWEFAQNISKGAVVAHSRCGTVSSSSTEPSPRVSGRRRAASTSSVSTPTTTTAS